jgi:uncharacterized membrane protein
LPRTMQFSQGEANRAKVRNGRLRILWDNLRTSFWFVPGLMGASAALLSWLAHEGDVWLSGEAVQEELPFIFYVGTAGDARDVISTLLGSMITMTSLVFSITMVVLTLAAGQFGPRLIRNFMASPHTQFVLGTFVMTTVYCLLALGIIGSRSNEELQVFVTVSLAIALALLSLALLVVFLHFLARSIVSESVIDRVGREISELWDELEPIAQERNERPEAALPDDYDSGALFFGPTSAGYVKAIEFEDLLELAGNADVLIGLNFAPGDYVIEGGRGIGIYPASKFTEELKQKVQGAIAVGPHRTPAQDPEFSIRHLVEIGVRALSPGVNDPYTAVAVINQLSASLSQLMGRALPPGRLSDAEGQLRVVCPRPTYATIVGAAFNQLRQNAAGAPLVYIYLVEALHRIAETTQLQVQRDALRVQLQAVIDATLREVPDGSDREAVDVRARAALDLLDQPRPA